MAVLPGTLSRPRRYVALALHAFGTRAAKTAHGVIAYGASPTVAVVDPDHSGKRVRDVLPHLDSDAPITASVADALVYEPSALLVGVAPPGGALPAEARDEIATAIRAGLDIVSGLHETLGDDAEFLELAHAHGVSIIDLREPPLVPIFSGAAYAVKSRVILTVGSDAAVGKMTASLELVAAAKEAGVSAAFVPTGQTGIAIAGFGIAIDRVIGDFAPGAAEKLVVDTAERAELLVVEGQGSIIHPAYAPSTLALLYGCAPDALVLVHRCDRHRIEGFGTPIPSYATLISLYESLCAPVKPARVVGIALNTVGLSEEAAQHEIEQARAQTGLPAEDLVRCGSARFFAAINPAIVKGRPETS